MSEYTIQNDIKFRKYFIARHGSDAKNGAVSWLSWGGDSAYKWLKTTKIRDALSSEFPKRKTSPKLNNLSC